VRPCTLHPKPETRNPEPETRITKHDTCDVSSPPPSAVSRANTAHTRHPGADSGLDVQTTFSSSFQLFQAGFLTWGRRWAGMWHRRRSRRSRATSCERPPTTRTWRTWCQPLEHETCDPETHTSGTRNMQPRNPAPARGKRARSPPTGSDPQHTHTRTHTHTLSLTLSLSHTHTHRGIPRCVCGFIGEFPDESRIHRGIPRCSGSWHAQLNTVFFFITLEPGVEGYTSL